MSKVAGVGWAFIGVAILLSSAVPAVAQSMPGIETKKVKTIPIHPDGPRQTFTPGAQNGTQTTPPVVDGPTVRVPTIRVSPTGEMTYPPPRDPADVEWGKNTRPSDP